MLGLKFIGPGSDWGGYINEEIIIKFNVIMLSYVDSSNFVRQLYTYGYGMRTLGGEAML